MATATLAQQAQVTNLYVALFNRAPDTAGLAFWSNAIANGASLSAITQGFLAAPEGVAIYPAAQSATAFVQAFYTTVFGRAADDSGLKFWTAALENSGGVASAAARSQLVSKIITMVNTPLGTTDAIAAVNAQTVLDRAVFANKVEYGLFVAQQTNSVEPGAAALSLTKITSDAASVAALKQVLVQGAVVPPIIAPTTPVVVVPVDTQVTLSRTKAELDAVGATAGNSTEDVLKLTINGHIAATPANVSGFENIEVTNIGNFTFNIDTLRFQGAKSITASPADGAAFNLANISSGQTAIAAKVGASHGVSFIYSDGATSAAVKVNDITGGSLGILGKGLVQAALESAGKSNFLAFISLGADLTSLTIDAKTDMSIAQVGGIAGGKTGLAVSIKGPGKVDLGGLTNTSLTNLNAAGSSGGVSSNFRGNGTDASTLVGSSGADVIRLQNNFVAGSSIDLGAGDDFVRGAGVTFGANVVVDGGAGTDLLSAYLVTSTTAPVFKNFERVNLSGDGTQLSFDISLLNNSTIEGVNLNGGTGGVTANNVLSAQSLAIRGASTGLTTINVKDAAANASDSYGISFSNAIAASNTTITAGRLALANVETVNIVSSGAVGNTNQITLEDAALKTLVLSGNRTLNVNLGATTATSLIDGTTATASLGIDTTNVVAASTGLTVKGGTAADTLTIAQAADVTGNGGADKFVLSNLALAAADDADIKAKLVTITDFAKGDSIDMLGASSGGAAAGIGALVDVTGKTTLLEAANQALAGATAAVVKAFVFQGNTYLVADAAGFGTLNTGDALVKLVGTPDLASVTANAITGDVVFV